MAARKKAKKKATARKKAGAKAAGKAAAKSRKKQVTAEARFQEVWTSATEAVHAAQAEAERQLTQVMKDSRLQAREVQKGVKSFRKRFDKERKRLVRDLQDQIGTLEDRVVEERKAFSSAIDTGMRSALAALNIPSRKEIADLTRKVEALSRKIDHLQR